MTADELKELSAGTPGSLLLDMVTGDVYSVERWMADFSDAGGDRLSALRLLKDEDILDRLEDSAETFCIGSRTWKISAGAFGCDVYEIVHDNAWETELSDGSGQNDEAEPDTRGRERRWFVQEDADVQDEAIVREDIDYDLDDERRRRIAEMLFPKWKSEFFRLRRT